MNKVTINTPFISNGEDLFEKVLKNAFSKTMTLITTKYDYFYVYGYGSKSITIEELKERTDIITFVEICKKNEVDYNDYIKLDEI